MSRVILHIPEDIYSKVQAHLLPPDSHSEEVGFLFVKHLPQDNDQVFEFLEWYPIPPEGFVGRSYVHLELTDEARAAVIKKAHDLDASIAEFHAHTGSWPASFSHTDILGFQEFVPHVWWRLRGKPYIAVVVTRAGFDALAWLSDPHTPQYLDGIEVAGRILEPTRLSLLAYNAYGQ